MSERLSIVFNGFLNLTNLEKLKLVDSINEYFDSNDREPIREIHNVEFEKIDFGKRECICCETTKKT
jgi:hypothetical protein